MTILPALVKPHPLMTVVRKTEETNRPDLPVLTLVSESGVHIRDLSQGGRAVSEDLSPYRVVEPGDLVVNRLWARFGAYGVSPVAGIISPAYWVLRIDQNRIYPRFLHHLLRSHPYLAEIGRRSKNMPPNGFDLPWEQFRRIPIESIPIERQRSIANFLDRETARLDALVEKKRKLIGLLKERTYSLASSVVAFGLHGTKTRETQSEWYPVNPIHWQLAPVRRLVSRLTSGSRGWAQFYSETGDTFLRIGNVSKDGIGLDLSEVRLVDAPATVEKARTAVRLGDLVVSITADVGSVAVIDDPALFPCFVSQHLALMSPHTGIDSRWMAYALAAAPSQAQLDSSRYGGTKTQLALRDVLDVVLPVPPADEQRLISHFLDSRSALYEATIESLREQVGLMTEYRQALITAAVTGELDVARFDADEGLEMAGSP